MSGKETLSFKIINVFIDRDYLESKIESIHQNIKQLPKNDQIAFNNQFRKYVKVLGFRNPLRAPITLQVKAHASAFEEKDEVVPFTLSTWTKLNQDFANQVKDWLDSLGWEDLALERSFESASGFINEWPKKLTLDKLVKQFKKDKPDLDFSQDDLILMVFWVSGQLPPEQAE